MAAAEPPGGDMTVDIDGDNRGNVVRVGAGGSTGDIAGMVVHGDLVIQLPEQFGSLLREAPTTAPPATPVSGLETPAVDVQPYAEVVAQALAGVRAAEESGQAVDAVQVGDVRVSKVELLLKRAVVLKAEANQMMVENATSKQPELQALEMRLRSLSPFDQAAVGQIQVEVEALVWRDFDRDGYTAKLTEARSLFDEVLALDDTNLEALLQLADLLMLLTPDDVTDEERVIAKAHALLSHPASDEERFMQAQALLISAQSIQLKYQRTPPGPELLVAAQTYQAALTEARDQFARLNRTMWATLADQLLQTSKAAVATWAGGPPASPAAPPPAAAYGAPAPGWGQPGAMPPPGYGAPYSFQPIGQWTVHVTNGGVVTESAFLSMGYDQSMQAVVSPSGVAIQGRWDFMPVDALLVLQGVANGTIPYALQIRILGAGPAAATGIDGSGAMYQFTRTA